MSFRAESVKKIAEPDKRLHTDSKTKGNHWGLARGETSANTGLYEPFLRLNKTRLGPVKISHDGEHPFNKATDKHERQQIKQNVGDRSNQRVGFDHGGGTRNHHHNNIDRPGDRHDDA